MSNFFKASFTPGSFGFYYAGYAADLKEVKTERETQDGGLTGTNSQLSQAENPSEDDMVKDFANRQRATFPDPREYSEFQGKKIYELLSKSSKSTAKAIKEAFSSLDALDKLSTGDLNRQNNELNQMAQNGEECKNALADAFNKCSDAASALADLYNTPGFLSNAAPELLEVLDGLQERLSTTPMQLGRVIDGFSFKERKDDDNHLSTFFANQKEFKPSDADLGNVKGLMTDIAALGKLIDDFVDLKDQEFDFKQVADKVKTAAEGALKKLESGLPISDDMRSSLTDKLRGLTTNLNQFKTVLEDLDKPEKFTKEQRERVDQRKLLERIFSDDKFSVRWYVEMLKRDVPEEMIDMNHSPDKYLIRSSVVIGEGAFNSVYSLRFKSQGSILENHEMMSKNLPAIKNKTQRVKENKTSNISLWDLDPDKVLYCNYASWKSSFKLTGTCPVTSSTVGEGPTKKQGEDRFSILMEKAPGKQLTKLSDEQKNFFPELKDKNEKLLALGQILEQASDLDISDWLSGQSDRHLGNVMLNLSHENGTVSATLRGIDNDQSFMRTRIGLQRIRLSADKFETMMGKWNSAGKDSWRKKWPYANIPPDYKESCKEWIIEVQSDKGAYIELDMGKAPVKYKGGFYSTLGLNSCRKPSYISQKTYNRIEAAWNKIKDNGTNLTLLREVLGIGNEIDDEAVEAAHLRFKEIVEHAELLKGKKLVFSDFKSKDSLLKICEACRQSNAAIQESCKQDDPKQSNSNWQMQAVKTGDLAWEVINRLGIDLSKLLDLKSNS